MLQHEMVHIFVEQHDVGLERVGEQAVRRHGERTADIGVVEAADAPAPEHLLDRADGSRHVDGQLPGRCALGGHRHHPAQ
ncbi:MAG TPA: hypothetical protein VLK25_13315, partial [Allosphingosinicella sp.]|nr:hypothetical protein [Allosphingosinicella sp.]